MEGELLISPCLPKAWKGFEARLTRPNGSLIIRVEDPDGIGSGSVTITVDGEHRPGGKVAFPTDGTTYQVHARIRSSQGLDTWGSKGAPMEASTANWHR
jgi:cyclic beta-1,2-glucan synthetase